jgi:ABC-type multidrug transport system fused ATPase/permease subunit
MEKVLMDLENLRGNMSIVPQDVILWWNYKENIAYGNQMQLTMK